MGQSAETMSDDNQEQKASRSLEDQYQRDRLTPEEVRMLDDKKITTHELAANHRRLKASANQELNRLVTADSTHDNLITLKEYKDFQKQLDDTVSPSKTKDILDRIKEFTRQKEKAQGSREEENKPLDPEDSRLLNLQKQFDQTCDDNVQFIGTKQLAGFKEWFAQERKKTPTLYHLKEQIKRLEGNELNDRNGLAPRREEYKNLQRLFQKYDLKEPIDSKWIKEEGLSERQDFRKKAEEMENHLQHQRDTGFYSKEMIAKTMQSVLKAENPSDQTSQLNIAKKVAQKESEGFTYFDGRITIGKRSIRKMSQASRKLYLDYYKNTDFAEREGLVGLKNIEGKFTRQGEAKVDGNHPWEKIVNQEAALAQRLAEIYGDDLKGLHLALDAFQDQDFMQKQGSLKMHKALVKEHVDKDKRHKILILAGTKNALAKATEKRIISKKTAERYQELFDNEDNYKDPDTKKPGDVKTLEKMYEILISPNPQPEHKNLAAYEKEREKFSGSLKELKATNPSMDQKELDKWQTQYDNEGWTKRGKTHDKLKEEILKQKTKSQKLRAKEGSAGIDKNDKKESKEFPKEKSKVIEAATIHMSEDNPREALKMLMMYDEQNPDDKQILFMIEMAAKQLREQGSKKEATTSFEQQMEEQLKKESVQTQNKKEIEEEQIIHLNIVGAKQSEQRHNKQKEAQARAKKESMTRVAGTPEEAKIVEAYYEQTDKQHILDKEMTGKKTTEVKFNDVAMTEERRHAAKVDLYQNQARITQKEGLLSQFKDKDGRILSAEEADKKQERDVDAIAEKLATEAYDKVSAKEKATGPKRNIFDLQQRITAKRKARELVDKKTNERIKQAA